MDHGRWYRLSGDAPDLNLPPTPPGTRYLADGDPACDPALNPARTLHERMRRRLGREWIAPWRGRVGFPAITEAWNGAIYASRCGSAGSMVVFGGGHNDYFGSDVHAFDLASRQWRRLSDGFIGGDAHAYGEGAVYPDACYPDGSPLPPHTYGYVQYDEIGNQLILLKGQTELGPRPKAIAMPQLLSLTSLRWRRGPVLETAILNSGGSTTWDSQRRLLWGNSGDDAGGNAFVAFCPDGVNDNGSVGSWRGCFANKLPGEANHNCMQIHPQADLIFWALHRRDTLALLDPVHPESPLTIVPSTGERPEVSEFAALDYSPGLNALVYYSATDGPRAFAIRWDGGVACWSGLADAAGLDPVADAAQQTRYAVNGRHTFGRFRVAHFADVDLALLVRHVDSPVYCLRIR
ncbi:MAG: hypothetical protein RIE06_28195 [Roseibium album]|uniref:hypothetical protein n=1 Tax=Roseibium album TaxID=311410 RepID=UPI0032EAE3C9